MWWQVINTALGIWLMAAPSILGYGDPARAHDRIVGPIIATLACVAIWEVVRAVRWANLPLGVWLLAAPWILHYPSTAAAANSMIVGAAITLFSFPRGHFTHQFAGGWASLWTRGRADQQSTH